MRSGIIGLITRVYMRLFKEVHMPPIFSPAETRDEATRNEDLSEQILVCAAQSGDSQAFVELCDRHSQKLLRRLYRITNNWHDAEDALQEALLNAFKHLNRFENRSSFYSWLTSIAINSGLMTLRRKRRLPVPLDDMIEYLPSVEYQGASYNTVNPQSLCEWHELQFSLKMAIGHLSPALRVVTEMHVLHERSIAEIAQDLDISKPAVKSRLSRARVRLRKSMAHKGRYGTTIRPSDARGIFSQDGMFLRKLNIAVAGRMPGSDARPSS
jgi:RNA polymerase sigma-70 factor, ECF subfamily